MENERIDGHVEPVVGPSCATCINCEEELVGDGTRREKKCLIKMEYAPSARHCKDFEPNATHDGRGTRTVDGVVGNRDSEVTR